MLETVLEWLKNWFEVSRFEGDFSIKGGELAPPYDGFLQNGQYFRINGSVFNDGLHQWPTSTLSDEQFNGTIWTLAIPKSLISISSEMEEWQSKNNNNGQYSSESFGGYSYTKATGENGKTLTVFDVFAEKLAPYRKAGGNYAFARPNPHMTPPNPWQYYWWR